MQRALSVEEIPDPFWAPPRPPAAMNRSSSEFLFERFLQDVASADDCQPATPPAPAAAAPVRDGGSSEAKPLEEMDPEEYSAMLKEKLQRDLAAVAMWRTAGAVPSGPLFTDSHTHPPNSAQPKTQPNAGGDFTSDHVSTQNKLCGRPASGQIPKAMVLADVKQPTSSSSREPSDDDDLEEEAETTGNLGEKLLRRKQSNRESARRSRSRKAQHLNDLEAQVAQLRVENSCLLNRLAEINQKYSAAAVDNRVLKADVETLRVKVKMAEEKVKQVTNSRVAFPAASDLASLSIPFSSCTMEAISVGSVPAEDEIEQYFLDSVDDDINDQHVMNLPGKPHSAIADRKIKRTASLRRVASLEHLQKRICSGKGSSLSGSCPKGSQDKNE